MDKDQAHTGMMPNPLDDTYLSCHACHIDYQQRAEKFAVILGMTPQSHEPVTTTVALNSSGGVPMVSPRSTLPTSNSGGTGPWWLLGLLAIAALMLAGVTVTRHRLSH